MFINVMSVLAAVCLAGCTTSSPDQVGFASASDGPAAASGWTEPTTVNVKHLATGEARSAVARAERVGATRGQAYRIGAHDKLDVSVFKVPDLSKSLDVSDAGSINFPLLGDVRVEGDTTREVEATLKRRLEARYLQNAQVTVQVSQFNSQRVTLDGAFKRPGVYPLRGRMTLLQAVAGAEGLTDSASEEILVFRAVSGKRAAAKFSIGAIRAGSSKDPVLQAGDVVIANTSSTKQAFKNLSKVLPIARFLLLL